MVQELNWTIGGAAGTGIDSAGKVLALALTRAGLNVFTNSEFASQIRGGHNFYRVRAAQEMHLECHRNSSDILMVLDKLSIKMHISQVVEGGIVFYDADEIKLDDVEVPNNIKMAHLPLKKLAEEAGSPILRNTIAVGATLGMLGIGLDIFKQILSEQFGKKGEELVKKNYVAADLGYNYAKDNYAEGFHIKLEENPRKEPYMLITGNEAVVLGALKGGCTFVAEYPMTPSSSILTLMAKYGKPYNILVKHTEDEIAAVNMLIGAGWVGARALTATSGGGFSLMSEAIGLAGQAEVPIVIVNVQRPGPSTGLPTRSGQGDLRLVMHASQDDLPRFVIAPGDKDECFYLTHEALNLAEKYQCPAIVLSDKYLAETIQAIPQWKTDHLSIDRGNVISNEELAKMEDFKRYLDTEDGVSPRSIPGQPHGAYTATSNEHDEYGDICEDAPNRTKMQSKRMRKIEEALKELPAPTLVGDEDADVTYVFYGSAKGAVKEAMQDLEKEGVKANFLQIIYMTPFHAKEVKEILSKCKNLILVEANYTGQLRGVVAENTGILMENFIRNFSGRPFTADEIVDATHRILKGETVVTIEGVI